MYFQLMLLAGFTAARCFDPTPSFPPPDLQADNPVLAQTFDYIHHQLLTVVNETKYENVSFAIDVTSSKGPLWSVAYTSPTNKASEQGVELVDDKTLFRIASITKTFTVLGILYQHAAGNLSLDDSVLKYLPELEKSASTKLAWKDITIRTLASQLSGIFRDVTFEDAFNSSPDAAMLGLPPNVSAKGLPICGEFSNFRNPCNASDLYIGFVGRSGPYAPNQKSTYSNEAFSILGLVLANVTGTPYSTYMQSAIFDPLGMNNTTLEPPPFSAGIIPPGEHYYGIGDDVNRPTGSIYSCTRDMSAYLRYILTQYNGLTHGAVNWFHPQSYAEGIQSFYGMPWEIFRSDKILPSTKRPVTFVTKAGSVPGYKSRIIMSAEHDIGVTILVAGDKKFVEKAQEIVTVPLIRTADKLAMAQLGKYEGTYVPFGSENDEKPLNTTITLRTIGHSGLRIMDFISNGTDVIAGATKFMDMQPSTHWHLAPTLLFKDFEKRDGELWRAVPVEDPSDVPIGAVWDEHCYTNVDIEDYAKVPFNELVFWMGGKRRVEELEPSGYRINLRREMHGDSVGEHKDPPAHVQQPMAPSDEL